MPARFRDDMGVREEMALFLFTTFYAAMAGAGYIIEIVFGALGLIPTERNAQVIEAHISWNYTTWLNIIFLILAAVLVVRFVRTGGVPMLRMMGGSPESAAEHTQGDAAHAHHGHGDDESSTRVASGEDAAGVRQPSGNLPEGRQRR